MKILFVCSRNKWRSRTAESIFKNNGEHEVKSAGTENSARIKLNQGMINWAEIIFVMEIKHKKKILDKFEVDKSKTSIEVLDIQDEYNYMDLELIEILKFKLDDLFNNGLNFK